MNDQSSRPERTAKSARQEFLDQWRRALSPAQQIDLGVQPYPGLRSFKSNEVDLFFGRDTQVNDLKPLLSNRNVIVVLGGSGSGKSSLVRAGLVPQLNSTSPIPGRSGAWYVVEFRPRTDPATELFDSILNQIIEPVLATIPRGEGDAGQGAEMEERRRRYRALSKAFGVEEYPPETPIDVVRAACRNKLRDDLYEGNVVDIGSLFDFAEEGLAKFDEALSRGMQSSAPNLLLLIDQFEEVFKPAVDPNGRNMIMSLVTSVHSYKPFNLFLIATMRSEELHRCSEFLGVADVVNGSLYLVDLIGGRHIEQAIVGPARRVLRSWDLDAGEPLTGPFTQRALSRLHDVFDESQKSLPHKADQLPLMQHLLPLVWEQAVNRWQRGDSESLKIDIEDLEAVPGWHSSDGPLIGCINARANTVLDHAIARAQEHAPMLDRKAALQLMQAASSCLAQLDDRGNVVRDFADLDRMLLASGVAERASPAEQQDCRTALKAALEEFQKATLIDVKANTYDVNHEALIRAWKTYKEWLAAARQRQESLVAVEQLAYEAEESEKSVGEPLYVRLARLGQRFVDAWSARRLARADQIVGHETGTALQNDVLGPSRVFSEDWARRTLEAEKVEQPDARLQAIRKTVRDAELYRNRVWNRYRPAFIMLAMTAIAGLGTALATSIAIRNGQAQFELFRLATTATSANLGRRPREDLETYAAFYLASKKHPDKLPFGQTSEALRATLQHLDEGIRQTVSDVSLRISERDEGLANGATDVDCIEVDPRKDQILLARTREYGIASRLGGRKLALAQASETRSWYAVSNGRVASGNLGNEVWPPGGIVCLSHDANWLLLWFGLDEGGITFPIIRRIIWIQIPSRPDEPEIGLHAHITDFRRVRSAESFDRSATLMGAISGQRLAIQNSEHSIRSFHVDGRAGFMVPLGDDADEAWGVIWTSTGFSDAEEASKSPELVPCSQKEPGKSDGPIVKCDLRTVEVENHQVRVLVEHERDTSDPVSPGEPGRRCTDENRICSSNVRLDFEESDRAVRMSINRHISTRIKAGAFVNGHLWLRDESGQIWRYAVAAERAMAVLKERWDWADWDKYSNPTPVSAACKTLQCAKNVEDWPTDVGE